MIDDYVSVVSKLTEFMTTQSPDDLLDELAGYFEERQAKYEIAKDKYKIKVQLVEDEQLLQMVVYILKADAGKYCVEFNRTCGDQLLFFKAFTGIKEAFDDIVDA